MRTEIGVHPWAPFFAPYLNGEPLEHCRMADEELGCAEVYEVEEQPDGRVFRTLQTRMVFGEIEDRPTNDVTRRIKAEPERAWEIWNAYREDLRKRIEVSHETR